MAYHYQPALDALGNSLGNRFCTVAETAAPLPAAKSAPHPVPLLVQLCVSVHPHKQSGKETRANSWWDTRKRTRQFLFCGDEAGLDQCLFVNREWKPCPRPVWRTSAAEPCAPVTPPRAATGLRGHSDNWIASFPMNTTCAFFAPPLICLCKYF